MKTLVLLATTAILATAPALAQQSQTVPPSASPTLGQPAGPGAPANQAGAVAGAATRAEVVSALEFVRKAAISDMYEVQSSQLAMQRSQNAQIRQFAQEMVQDHQKTTNQLQELVRQVPAAGAPGTAGGGAAVTTGATFQFPMQLDAEHMQKIQQLQQAQGAEFDRLYVQQQVMAHQTAVDMFQNFARAGDTPRLQQFAQQTLPDLQDHLRKVQQIQSSLRG
jgi:putative membrane protein